MRATSAVLILLMLAAVSVAEIAVVQAAGTGTNQVMESTKGQVRWIGAPNVDPGSYPGTLVSKEGELAECVCPTDLSGCLCHIVEVRPRKSVH